MKLRCLTLARAAAVAIALLSPAAAVAQAQPSAPAASGAVTLVVPFPAGGGAHFVASVLAPAMSRQLGEEVRIETRPGDYGQRGTQSVNEAAKDGRTLLLGSTSSLLAPALDGRTLFDPLTDFEPIALVATVARVLAVHPALPAKSVDDLVRLVRKDPALLRCGVSDALSHYAATEFARIAGIEMPCADYQGAIAEMRADVVSGRINITFESAFVEEAQKGTLRPLAVLAQSRMLALPAVPTASETGLPGLEATAWLALLAPPGVPEATLARLAEAAARAVAQPDVQEALQRRGFTVRPLSAGQTRQYLREDHERWRQLQLRRGKRTGVDPTEARIRTRLRNG